MCVSLTRPISPIRHVPFPLIYTTGISLLDSDSRGEIHQRESDGKKRESVTRVSEQKKKRREGQESTLELINAQYGGGQGGRLGGS